MDQKTINFSWKNFGTTLSSVLINLYKENSFADVTLVSDDQTQFQAHKFILSACSSVMKNILINNPHANPLIFLRGVNQQELQSMLQFIYLGETKIDETCLDNFLHIVKDFDLNELTQFLGREDDPVNIIDDDDPYTNTINDEIQNNRGSGIERPGDVFFNEQDQDAKYSCNQCPYQAKGKRNFERHQKWKHASIDYSCNQCQYRSGYASALRRHKQSIHDGIKYLCDQCEYQATQPSSLTTHKQSIHEGVKYYCDKCEFQTGDKSSLRKHLLNKHEGVKYKCNYFEYQAGDRCYLKRHEQSIHEGVRYSCDQCEYQAGQKTHLKTHKKGKHPTVE